LTIFSVNCPVARERAHREFESLPFLTHTTTKKKKKRKLERMEVEKKHSTNDSKLEELRSLVTNQVVLIWVAIFFALFVVAEMIGALVS
jgi:hypothetical protein